MNNSMFLTLCFVLLIGFSGLSFSCHASEIILSPEAIRILNNIDKRRSKMTIEDINAAKSLNKKGDKAYKQKKYYYEAFRWYDNSSPNFPNAYAYILSGDSHWRGIVQYLLKTIPDEHHCRLVNNDFSDDLDQDISQTYEVGIALAIKDNEKKLIASDLYKRATESAICLRKLVDFYKTKTPDTCVDLNKIQSCLGKPLIK